MGDFSTRFRPARRRLIAALIAVAMSKGTRAEEARPSAVAVAVSKGRASFDLAGKKTLVIVSALSRQPGPFPVRLDARPIANPSPTKAMSEGQSRPIPELGPVAVRTPPRGVIPPSERSFGLLVRDGDPASAANYLTIRARLARVGEHIQVYVDPDDAGRIDPGLLTSIVETFDEQILPLAARRFGAAADVDGDGRFTIFVSSWLDRIAGGRANVDGFVRGADLDLTLGAPFGNRCDMMYLNAGLKPGPHARTVLAHEYAHAVIFSRKAIDSQIPGRVGEEEEGWLDEGLAHLVEDLHGFSKSNIDYRVSAFLSRPEQYRLIVHDYYSADLFRSHGNRGGTYLFLRWLVDRYGDPLVDRLVRSDRRGVANLEAATGRPFADLYREWSVALFLSGLEPEREEGKVGLYRSIDTRGTLEDWILAGPRTSRVRAGGAGDAWSMVGTSSYYTLVEGPEVGATRVEVIATDEAELQVTAVPLPDDLGSVDLSVSRSRGRDGRSEIRASLSDRGASPVRLGALCWEPLLPTRDETSAGFARGGLDMLGIASLFGSSALPTNGRKSSRAFPIGASGEAPGPIVFKAVGTDAKGRRVAAWAELKRLPPGGDDELADQEIKITR